MTTLYIAEKKEVATALAEALNGKTTTPHNSAYIIPTGNVTWLYGHMLSLTNPEDHDPKYAKWNLNDLPATWPISHAPTHRTQQHLQAVLALIQQADTLINAGDPDPEGQRLVDEVIEYAQATGKPCQRILINDNNPAAILKANARLKPNSNYHGLSMSALARAVCDQRYGYNLSRLYTLSAQQSGFVFDGTLTVGRVQTPILGLVVARDRQYQNHEKQAFYTVLAHLKPNSIPVRATYQATTTDLTDATHRLIDPQFAQALARATENNSATIESVTTQERQRPAPLPYNLLALQADAAQAFGYTPKRVLEMTQSLRDKHRAITYNRSDCRYLNDERHADAPVVIQALQAQYGLLANNATPALKSKAFNSAKVTAHHAIIPTANVPDMQSLSEPERNIYDLITRLYLAQFYPPECYRSTLVIFAVITDNETSTEPFRFKTTGRVDVSSGWLNLFDQHPEDENTEPADKINLEQLQPGEVVTVDAAEVKTDYTKPLPLYSMSSLLKDLARVAKYVKDPRIKRLLLDKDVDKQDEAGGIGTPATRDTHIDKLFTRGFLTESAKSVISTPLGQNLIAALPDFATAPDLTALWHEKQKEIEQGTLDYQALIDEVDTTIAAEVTRIKQAGLQGLPQGQTCPTCHTGHLRRRNGQHGHFWSCNRYPECKTSYPDKSSQPDLTPKTQWALSTEHLCPQCHHPLIRQPSKKKKGQYWWGCSAWREGCKHTAQDNNGQPK